MRDLGGRVQGGGLKRLVAYRAGRRALTEVRRSGLVPEIVRAFAGAASGPRWLVLAELDQALLRAGFVDGGTSGKRRLLVGASAGAWRMLALAVRDPAAAHRRLVLGYTGQVFSRDATAASISAAYRQMLAEILGNDVDHALSHPSVDIAVHVARARRWVPWRGRATQMATMAATAALNAVSRGAIGAVFERVLAHSAPERFGSAFGGTVVPLTEANLLDAALASGTVPVYMQPVPQLGRQTPGRFVDGGLTDYHLRQRYVDDDRGITLFPHFQREIAAVWFDRFLWRRGPSDAALDNVVQIFPTDAFLDRLPGRKLPDRDDFFRFASSPGERIRRWSEATRVGADLAEQVASDLGTGRLIDLVEPLGCEVANGPGTVG